MLRRLLSSSTFTELHGDRLFAEDRAVVEVSPASEARK